MPSEHLSRPGSDAGQGPSIGVIKSTSEKVSKPVGSVLRTWDRVHRMPSEKCVPRPFLHG